jgi:RNA polymerase sigma factor (TIGR02999 family)
MDDHPSLTEQLRKVSAGNPLVAETVLVEIMPTLHKLAVRAVGGGRSAAISPTELINEVWIRNFHRGGWPVESRQHFYNLVALAMRHLLVDFARKRQAECRGGRQSICSLNELPKGLEPSLSNPELVLEVVRLIEKLEKDEPEQAQVVNLHYLLGYSLQEIAEIKGLKFRQVRTLWEKGSRWLRSRLRSYRRGL